MKVVFRVDANPDSGFGHFSRCLSLARTWLNMLEHTEIAFVGNYTEFAIGLFNQYHIAYKLIEEPDYSNLHNHLLIDANIVVFDSYNLTQQQLEIIVKSPYKSILIDDDCKLDYKGIDAVVNFRFDAEKMYHYKSNNQYLGTNYFLIKPEIVALRKINESKTVHPVNNILLFFGGGFSNENFLVNLIKFINKELPHVKPKLIYSSPLKQVDYPINYEYVKPTLHIEKLLEKTDLIINGGGLIKYEATFALIPTATISTTSLQFKDSVILEQFGVHNNAGLIDSFSMEIIYNKLSTIIHNEVYRKNLVNKCREEYTDNPTLNLIKQFLIDYERRN